MKHLCIMCGEEFDGTDRAKYCPSCCKRKASECAKKRNLCYCGSKARWSNREKEETETEVINEKTNDFPVCPSDCIWLSREAEYQICNFFITGDNPRRGCPAGENCTRYESTKLKRRKASHRLHKSKKQNTQWKIEAKIYKAIGGTNEDIAAKTGKSLKTVTAFFDENAR